MNMLDEYAKITESTKKTDVSENTITDEFIEKLAKKVANVLMQSADGNTDDDGNIDDDGNADDDGNTDDDGNADDDGNNENND